MRTMTLEAPAKINLTLDNPYHCLFKRPLLCGF